MRVDVDVLTLTATPIPRTLEMSLSNIRDLSIIETAPADRRPVRTFVGPFDERLAHRGDPARARARRTGLRRPQPRAVDRT